MPDNCQFVFSSREQTVIVCQVHNEREVLKPATRNQTLALLVQQGKWAGPISPGIAPPEVIEAKEAQQQQQVAVPPPKMPTDLVTYNTFAGNKVELTIQAFQSLLCPQASRDQAMYMLQWASHNQLDPFTGEAHFAIMDGKPVLQVSKDAWLRRVEANPRFIRHDGGIIVETTVQIIRDAVIAGVGDDYLCSQVLKEKILADFVEGKGLDYKNASPQLEVKKRGMFLNRNERLIGGWALVYVKDREKPYRFEIDKEGWQTTTKEGKDNVFWSRKGAFMAYKSALKNACRLAFPELSGLMIAREKQDETFEAQIAEEVEHYRRVNRQKALFAEGRKVPPPLGPLGYEELHRLAVGLTAGFESPGRGISELEDAELETLIEVICTANDGDGDAQHDLEEILNADRERPTEATPTEEAATASTLPEAGEDANEQPTKSNS